VSGQSDASVVIVSYRPGDWLAPCVESAVAQSDDVVVVDNGSSGEEATAIARQAGARVIRCAQNLGFAGGAHAGLAQVRHEVVGILNDDAVADPGWLASAARVLADPQVGAVTPKVVLAGYFAEVVPADTSWLSPGDARPLGRQVRSIEVDGVECLTAAVGTGLHEVEAGPIDGVEATFRWTAGDRPFSVPVAGPGATPRVMVDGEEIAAGPVVRVVNHAGSFLRGHGVAGEYGAGVADDGRLDEPAERFGFSGTAPVFRSETLARIGSFAPQFFAYNEDTDWCLRAHLAGLRIQYDPTVRISHLLSATSGGAGSPIVQRLAQRNALLCLVRNAPWPVAREHVAQRLRSGPAEGLRRACLAKLPWATITRLAMARKWQCTPEEVWSRWADQDLEWDRSPARPGAGAN
jgi:GT2 family glycosyltransferase